MIILKLVLFLALMYMFIDFYKTGEWEGFKWYLMRNKYKIILWWHLSKWGKKIDFFLIRLRKKEFHPSLDLDTCYIHYLDEKDYALYQNNLLERRSYAHSLDMRLEDSK